MSKRSYSSYVTPINRGSGGIVRSSVTKRSKPNENSTIHKKDNNTTLTSNTNLGKTRQHNLQNNRDTSLTIRNEEPEFDDLAPISTRKTDISKSHNRTHYSSNVHNGSMIQINDNVTDNSEDKSLPDEMESNSSTVVVMNKLVTTNSNGESIQQEIVDLDSIENSTDEFQLTEEQKTIVQYIIDHPNESVTIEGPAGSGKSVLSRYLARKLKGVLTVGPTGISSVNVCGRTFHSWFDIYGGVNLFTMNPEKHYAKMLKQAKTNDDHSNKLAQLESCLTFIIDEMSMVTKLLFVRFEQLLRLIKNSPLNFGGVRIIAVGDFLQLAPVVTKFDIQQYIENSSRLDPQIVHTVPLCNRSKATQALSRYGQGFIFELKLWEDTFTKAFVLQEIHRQKDPTYSKILNQLRFGFIQKQYIPYITRCIHPIPKETPSKTAPTRLCPTKLEAKLFNESNLRKLPDPNPHIYHATYENMSEDMFKSIIGETTIPEELELKLNTQVSCIKNIKVSISSRNNSNSTGPNSRTDSYQRSFYIPNGSRGRVVGWHKPANKTVKKGTGSFTTFVNNVINTALSQVLVTHSLSTDDSTTNTLTTKGNTSDIFPTTLEAIENTTDDRLSNSNTDQIIYGTFEEGEEEYYMDLYSPIEIENTLIINNSSDDANNATFSIFPTQDQESNTSVISPTNSDNLSVNSTGKNHYSTVISGSDDNGDYENDEDKIEYPIVRFDNIPEDLIIPPATWKFPSSVKSTKGTTKSKPLFNIIRAIPLKLSWGDTVHSCQGITADSVAFNLGESCGFFTEGQAYVAFSRSRKREDVNLEGFTPDNIKAHPSALEYTIKQYQKCGAHQELLNDYFQYLRDKEDDHSSTIYCDTIIPTRVSHIFHHPSIHIVYSNSNRLKLPEESSMKTLLSNLLSCNISNVIENVNTPFGSQVMDIDKFTRCIDLLQITPVSPFSGVGSFF